MYGGIKEYKYNVEFQIFTESEYFRVNFEILSERSTCPEKFISKDTINSLFFRHRKTSIPLKRSRVPIIYCLDPNGRKTRVIE